MNTDPGLSRSFWIGLISCWCLFFPSLQATPTPVQIEQQVDLIMAFAEEEVKERLELLDQSLLEHRLDKAVRNTIARHLRYSGQTSRNLGRAIAYFPIFEAELKAAGLPETLKYLPVIESALVPRAMSRVGAEGLWQFMPETAPEYGLRIDEYLDERLDTYCATQGAIRYLQSAYEYLGDWSLAIAAYNSGKGRVRRAQRRSGGKNFWAVRRYLPRESRHYVPAFIAAIYLTEFYAAHEIQPEFPSLDQQLVERIVIKHPLSFYRIAQVTGLSVAFIQYLNPVYLKGYLPGYAGGHNLILPQRVVPAMRAYLDNCDIAEDEPVLPWAPVFNLMDYQPRDAAYYQSFQAVAEPEDSLASLAARAGLTASQLAIWNNFSPLDTLVAGQELCYYRPVRFHQLPERNAPVSTWWAPSITMDRPVNRQDNAGADLPAHIEVKRGLVLQRRERPTEILARYPSLSSSEFYRVNELSSDRPLPAGSVITLPNPTSKRDLLELIHH